MHVDDFASSDCSIASREALGPKHETHAKKENQMHLLTIPCQGNSNKFRGPVHSSRNHVKIISIDKASTKLIITEL
jgi:hypothetical protein